MSDISQFYGPNAGYVLDLYDRFREDPASVDEAYRSFFTSLDQDGHSINNGTKPAPVTIETGTFPVQRSWSEAEVTRAAAAARLARFIRQRGHLGANIDPLNLYTPIDPGLQLADHNLTAEDLLSLPSSVVGGPIAEESKNSLEAIERLYQVYSGTIGYDDEHIQNNDERYWLRNAAESREFFLSIDSNRKREVLERLTEVETFERFLHKTFVGAKRFSIEGTDMLVPVLDEIIHSAADAGTHEVVMGMAHRGRLNVLTHILGKPYARILAEFESAKRDEGASVAGKGTQGWTGDVKYHLGHRRAFKENGSQEITLTLVPNPSHLEFVNPVVEGHVRAAQDQRSERGLPTQDISRSLALLIHGDAAFPGQGIVSETLNLSQLKGYGTGGSIHIIVNNQIGFMTTPEEGRSTTYASDLAKGFEIPIVHVNADDPEACIAAARMAFAYRQKFHKDFLIDLIGYRRYGHNEGEEPGYTQPIIYEHVGTHPTVREIWAEALEKQGVVLAETAPAMLAAVHQHLQGALLAARTNVDPKPASTPSDPKPKLASGGSLETAVPEKQLEILNESLLQRPAGFTPNPKLERLVFIRRRENMHADRSITWGHAESLAYASILADGIPIRLSGQDSQPGTFGHRHSVLHDPHLGTEFVPLQSISESRASFAVYNSPLSENAVLGFEYGYSMQASRVLVLWEAQFGDFCNGAQVIIDQFLVSGNAKWRQIPSLVLLLPHGYEGQGPEHSSARLERFLQLAANDNIRVVNCTTPAQFFHVLRRQAGLLETDPRPLIVMTPKSLLKEALVASSLSDLTEGAFKPVLNDSRAMLKPDEVTRLVLCSGKIYVDVLKSPSYINNRGVAVVRVEELYPFPMADIKLTLEGYPNVRELIWMQEEPRNMGAWTFVEPLLRELGGVDYVGRAAAASPAEGSPMRHQAEQARIINTVLCDVPELPEVREKTVQAI